MRCLQWPNIHSAIPWPGGWMHHMGVVCVMQHIFISYDKQPKGMMQ